MLLDALNFSVGSTGHFCGDKGLRNDGCIENDPIKGKKCEVRHILIFETKNISFFRCYFLLLYQKLVQRRTDSHEVIHHSAKKNH